MSIAYQEIVVSDRKQQVLQEAIGNIASEGSGKLTMRTLARAMKLGALQYHFRTWKTCFGLWRRISRTPIERRSRP